MHQNTDHDKARRRAGVLAVLASMALLTTACGGSSGSSTGLAGSSEAGGSTTYQKELAYAQCMRSHGVPNFPDPSSNGLFVNNGTLHLESGQGQAALKECRHLLPSGGVMSPAQREQATGQLLKFAHCMRSHGVPNFPDPRNGGISLKGSGIDPGSPQFQSAQRACQALMPKPGRTP